MRKYVKEIFLCAAQLFMFYIFPLFAGPTDAMGMVFLMIVATFLLSMLMGCLSGWKGKYLYSVAAAVVFIPSVFIYYNSSALVHAQWYLVIATVGLALGSLLRWIFRKK